MKRERRQTRRSGEGGHGDVLRRFGCLRVSVSPCLRVASSRCLRVSVSPCVCASVSPCFPVVRAPCLSLARLFASKPLAASLAPYGGTLGAKRLSITPKRSLLPHASSDKSAPANQQNPARQHLTQSLNEIRRVYPQ